MTMNINTLRQSTEYSFVASDVGFRFGWMASSVSDTANTATHMLITGLYPVGDSSNVVSSYYEAIDISDGAVMDVGVVYLTLPAGSEPPAGSVASPIVGVVQRQGPWSNYASSAPASTVGESSGAATYDGNSGSISVMVSRGATTFSGSVPYTVADLDTLELGAFSLTDATVTYNFGPTTLVRDGERFYGTLYSSDSSVGYDSMVFVVELAGIEDADFDGLPDIVDTEVSPFERVWVNHTTFGWAYMYEPTVMWTHMMGFVDSAAYPWIYQWTVGWMHHSAGDAASGNWFHNPQRGWIYVRASNAGMFYQETPGGVAWELQQF